jgi:transposase
VTSLIFYCPGPTKLGWFSTNGQFRHLFPSLDPVVFFKLVLMGRLENIVSDRRIIEQSALRLDVFYFLGYEVDEDYDAQGLDRQQARLSRAEAD